MKVRVYHSYYGCDTGCCGHNVELEDGRYAFEFKHPYDQNEKEWARALAEKVIQERWPECLATIDWDTLEIEVTNE